MSQELSFSKVPWAALGTVLCWGISPTFIRWGLEDLDSPVLAVTVGMVANVIAYGVLLFVQRSKWQGQPIERSSFNWQFWAAVFVGLATWARWVAIDLNDVAVALAIGRINVPIVLVLSIMLLDQSHERITWKVWVGAGFIVAGSVVLSVVK